MGVHSQCRGLTRISDPRGFAPACLARGPILHSLRFCRMVSASEPWFALMQRRTANLIHIASWAPAAVTTGLEPANGNKEPVFKIVASGTKPLTRPCGASMPGFEIQLDPGSYAGNPRGGAHCALPFWPGIAPSGAWVCHCSAGANSSGPSFLALFTSGDTGKASICSAGHGLRSLRSASCFCSGSSQVSASSGARITGMRLRMPTIRLLGSVVMIAQVVIFPSGPAQLDSRPANTKITPKAGRMKWGTFALPVVFHLKKPDAGIRHRP